ncbi:MAG: hypothetical protein PHH36_11400 [Sideroxydans sp.]|nr:hypothetical protein [Sideroxydans sp.]
MGPIVLFDKSFLQSLSVDESVWFDHFFYPNICPLFYVETLADLAKSTGSSGRKAVDEVRIIADKTPTLSGAPCIHHRDLCIANLMGHPVPMTGQIPMAGGRPVRSPDGKLGVVFDESPEAQAFTRWQQAEFLEIERRFANQWRAMLTTLDLKTVAERMQKCGVTPKECKTIEQAHSIAEALVHTKHQQFEQMGLLFAFLDIPQQLRHPILESWSNHLYKPLAEYAPFAAHVLTVEIFFQIALAANLISAERASNRVDIAYLFYLPFCMAFASGDKLHQRCSGVFLRKDQSFIWGPDLKTELQRLNAEYSKLPETERELGVMKFAATPIGTPDDLIIKLFSKHLPSWRRSHGARVTPPAKSEKVLVEKLKQFTDAPTSEEPIPDDLEMDQLAIKRMVPKRKGNWWVLPKDLKVEE